MQTAQSVTPKPPKTAHERLVERIKRTQAQVHDITQSVEKVQAESSLSTKEDVKEVARQKMEEFNANFVYVDQEVVEINGKTYILH